MAFKIRIAELLCEIHNRYEWIRRKCTGYIVQDTAAADISVTVSDEYLTRYIDWCASIFGPDVPRVSEEIAEYYVFWKELGPHLLDFDALCLHATAVEYQGGAYLFTAPSGYGKTTHARLWVKAFAPDARIINGDHPIVRWQDGQFIAYGTPFCGKEGYNENVGVPVQGICYLTHSDTNSIRPMAPSMAFAQLFYDLNSSMDTVDKYFDMVTRLVEHVPVYQLCCNQEEEAARVAYAGMQQK